MVAEEMADNELYYCGGGGGGIIVYGVLLWL